MRSLCRMLKDGGAPGRLLAGTVRGEVRPAGHSTSIRIVYLIPKLLEQGRQVYIDPHLDRYAIKAIRGSIVLVEEGPRPSPQAGTHQHHAEYDLPQATAEALWRVLPNRALLAVRTM